VGSAPLRIVLVVIALVAGARLVLGVRALELEADGTVSSLRDARLLSVDKEPLMNEGLQLFASGRREDGLAVAERVVADEPENLEGWLSLSYIYAGLNDPQRAAYALRRARALNPFIRPGAAGP
jgi:cytochrome c-type biogenesis protein CcmH/NrfG